MNFKKIIFIALAGFVFAGCNQQPANEVTTTTVNNTPDGPIMSFEKEIYEFGTIKEGELVNYEFKFKNTGKTPLIITDATATCGCTIPEPPKEPIKPGDSGVIKVVFNSQGKVGLNDKVITITSNANPGQSMVHLVGEVLAK